MERIIFADSQRIGLKFREELKTAFKFASHINPIECSSTQEKELKDQLEEVILSNAETAINSKVKEFTNKVVDAVAQRRRRSPVNATSVPCKPRNGKTEKLDVIKFEEGWNVGGNRKGYLRVDDIRLSELKENASYIDLTRSVDLGYGTQKIDTDYLLEKFKDNEGKSIRVDPMVIDASNPIKPKIRPTVLKSEDEKELVLARALESTTSKKILAESMVSPKRGPLEYSKTPKKKSKKKSAKKSAKKKSVKKKTSKKVGKNERRKTVS